MKIRIGTLITALAIVSALFLPIFVSCPGYADDRTTVHELFQGGNQEYQKGDYVSAVGLYKTIEDKNAVCSGPLSYNIGNAYFKLGKKGMALLNYERAMRLVPHDSDLVANLNYLKSLLDVRAQEELAPNIIIRAFIAPVKTVSVRTLVRITAGTYLLSLILISCYIVFASMRKVTGIPAIFTLCIFLYCAAACSIRIYYEDVKTVGVVISQDADARYEPLARSNMYFKLAEGSKVYVLKESGGWKRVARYDGKTGWVSAGSVENI